MVKLINKNGLEIACLAKPVMDELMRGTGSVMADKLSLYLESPTFNEKYIVVARSPEEPNGAPEMKKYSAANFKDAWEQFQLWLADVNG